MQHCTSTHTSTKNYVSSSFVTNFDLTKEWSILSQTLKPKVNEAICVQGYFWDDFVCATRKVNHSLSAWWSVEYAMANCWKCKCWFWKTYYISRSSSVMTSLDINMAYSCVKLMSMQLAKRSTKTSSTFGIWCDTSRESETKQNIKQNDLKHIWWNRIKMHRIGTSQ